MCYIRIFDPLQSIKAWA